MSKKIQTTLQLILIRLMHLEQFLVYMIRINANQEDAGNSLNFLI